MTDGRGSRREPEQLGPAYTRAGSLLRVGITWTRSHPLTPHANTIPQLGGSASFFRVITGYREAQSI